MSAFTLIEVCLGGRDGLIDGNEAVRRHRQRVDAAFDEEACERRPVARGLAAQPRVNAARPGVGDDGADRGFNRLVLLVEQVAQEVAVPVDAEDELGEIV